MTQQLLAAAAVLFGFAVSRRASGEDAAPDLEAVATPSAARGFDGPLPLSPEQVASWRERGFAVVDGLLPGALVAAARDDLRALDPGPGVAREGLVLARFLDVLGDDGPGEVPDPYYGDEDGFGHVLNLVERASDLWLARLRERL